MTLSEIREALEKAEGPSRELDLAIGNLWPDPPFSLSIEQQRGGKPPVYNFTASVDAALSLVERKLPGWTHACDATAPEWGVDWELFENTETFDPDIPAQHIKGTARTIPLAILSALIRALEEGAEK